METHHSFSPVQPVMKSGVWLTRPVFETETKHVSLSTVGRSEVDFLLTFVDEQHLVKHIENTLTHLIKETNEVIWLRRRRVGSQWRDFDAIGGNGHLTRYQSKS